MQTWDQGTSGRSRAVFGAKFYVSIISLIVATAGAQPSTTPLSGLPMYFEANHGQAAEPAQFLARGLNYQFLLAPAEAKISLCKVATPSLASPLDRDQLLAPRSVLTRTLRMELLGANAQAPMAGQEEMPGKINYLIGKDPAHWHAGVPTFAKVQVRGIYPGIDLVYYGNQQRLEYDFTIAPRADPRAITIRFNGADKVSISDQGELVVRLGDEEIVQSRPELYQIAGGVRRLVNGGYRRIDPNTVSFAVGSYDRDLPLVIDPVLNYSSYFGGNYGDVALSVKVNKNGADGAVYIAGETFSTAFLFLLSGGVVQPVFRGGTLTGDGFIAKFTNPPTNLLYMTYLGGTADDGVLDLAVDALGNAFVTGFTASSNFPTINALYPNINGTVDPGLHVYPNDVFVAELNPSGSALLFSTYLGGSLSDVASGIAVDPSGNIYVTGYTFSSNFPAWNPLPFHATIAGSNDAFVTKLAPGGSAFIYSTYLGGTNADEGEGISADAAGFAYVTGLTASTNFPVTFNALRPQINNSPDPVSQYKNKSVPYDAFVAKLSPGGAPLVYCTYLGSTNVDAGFRIRSDAAGNAYVTGQAGSGDFPRTVLFPFGTNRNEINAFLTKINSNGTAFAYSAVFGGTNNDVGWDVALDALGNAYVIGITASSNFPVTLNVPGLSGFNSGGLDAFVAAFNTNATAFLYSGYLGGSTNDYGYGIDVDLAGNAYLAGRTLSTNFPVRGFFTGTPPFQPALYGTNDAFLAMISMEPTLITTAQGNTVQLMWRTFAPGYLLESNTNLASASTWVPVSQTPVVSNGFYNVSLVSSNASLFFRLHRP